MKTRNDKIARLPRDVRKELNQRLDNGQTDSSLGEACREDYLMGRLALDRERQEFATELETRLNKVNQAQTS